MYDSLSNSDDYIGMKSDFESFISEMQRKRYLVNFTEKKRDIEAESRKIAHDVAKKLNEERRRNKLNNIINESIRKSIQEIL